VSTGTGSTSWHTSINRLSKKNVEDLLNILKGSDKSSLANLNAEEISEEYNRRLVFEQGEILSIDYDNVCCLDIRISHDSKFIRLANFLTFLEFFNYP
jgi:hypothetical protein